MNSIANNIEHENQSCDCKSPLSRKAAPVKALAYIPLLVVLVAGLLCPARAVFADPRIEVRFEADAADSQKLIHAQTVFDAPHPVVCNIFSQITAYPMLHDWIRETTLVKGSSERQEYLVEFAFPWPVGRQWSRVEVHHSGNTIIWRQVDGSLNANHGRISFTTTHDSKVIIDYRAAIDIGLPELWTQSYKEKFIREFLTAAYSQVETAVSPTALVLAAEQ